MTEGRIEALGDDPARDTGSPVRFINGLCRRLVSAGVPLWRVTSTRPRSTRRSAASAGAGGGGRIAEEVQIAQGTELTDEFLQIPLRGTIEHGVTLRRRLDGAYGEFPLLDEFRADGCTEYLAVPLNRINRRYPVVAWATDRAGGLTEADIALLEQIRPALAAVIQMLATLRTARGLFSIYLDRDVGKRLIDGQIKRGHTEPFAPS